MENPPMHGCMKRRLLYASAEAYHPGVEASRRAVEWIEPPIIVRRNGEIGHRAIDLALVGRVREGVVVAFRGSLPPAVRSGEDGWAVLLDWLNDSLSLCVDLAEYGGGVHLGFADSMWRLWQDADGTPGVRSAVQRLLDRSRVDHAARPHLFLTGHSKGGALANLAAYRAARLPAWRDLPISVATIAAVRAGNAAFARAYAAERIACLRYEIPSDLVPHLPPGPATPRWLHAIARQIAPRLATADYHPVGERVSAAPATGPWLSAWLRHVMGIFSLRGIKLAALSPAALAAHAICPQSAYDRLICTGEATCEHGRSGRAST
jgi:hypothetical protein